MKIYQNRPSTRTAQRIWDYVTRTKNEEPQRLWKNPNAWGGPRSGGDMWGWWVAELRGEIEYILPLKYLRLDKKHL